MSALHPSASTGFQSGAQAYARGRPDYPPEVSTWLAKTLDVGPGRTVLDMGAGTGKFTAALAATGARVIAVEPVAAMRERLEAALPGVTVLAGRAEAIPLADAAVDVVVCAQSFHWFANVAALAEIVRVLVPGGSLGLIWNLRDENVPWVAKLSDIIAPYEGDAPRAYKGTWKAVFPFPGLSPFSEARFIQPHTGSPEDVIIARTLSTSVVAALPQSERDIVIAQVRDIIAGEPALAGKSEVTYPYVTFAYRARRI